MEDKKNKPLSVPKTLSWVYGAVTAFTAISIIVPIVWERVARRNR